MLLGFLRSGQVLHQEDAPFRILDHGQGALQHGGVYAFRRLQPTSIIGFDGQDFYMIFEQCLPLADAISLKKRKLVKSGEFHYPVLKAYS